MINPKFLLFQVFFSFSSLFTSLFAQDTLLKARYVSLPYSLINDRQVSLTPTDYVFWRSEIGELKQVYFTSFDIDFTKSDSLEAYQMLKKKSQNFANNFQDTTLLFQNGGQIITLNSQASVPYVNKSVGSIITFIKDNHLYVSKIISKKSIADSVRAKHILFLDATVDKVEKILSDLKNKKISWENVNQLHNKDHTAERGGDLGYFTQGMMVEAFDNLCFNIANISEYYRVTTPFGEHIVQVIDKKFSGNTYSIQTVGYKSPVLLSEKTLNAIEAKAERHIGKCKSIDELEKKLRKEGVEFKQFTPIELPPSEVNEWLETVKNGDITLKPLRIHDEFNNKDKIMILGVRVSQGSAISDDDLIKQYGDQMRKKKKAELLFQDLKKHKSLESIASKYDVEIKDIFLPVIENENSTDELVSNGTIQNTLLRYEVNKLTAPISGYNGIYVAYISWKK